MSATPDPKQVIIDELCHPRSTSSWIGSAVKEKIYFIREYSLPDRQVHIVIYEDINGQVLDYIANVSRNELGVWQVNGTSKSLHKGSLRKKPTLSFPWVRIIGGGWGNLGNGWGNHFSAGGYLTDKAIDAKIVRLIFKNGAILEDSVQNDTVLFITDQKVQVPVQVEVYNGSGELLGTQIAFDYEDIKGGSEPETPEN